MQRMKCTISYDGTLFSGYQVQVDKRTVQSELESVLEKMHKKTVKVVASGRTDAGVHAVGQVIHFDTHLDIPAERWRGSKTGSGQQENMRSIRNQIRTCSRQW